MVMGGTGVISVSAIDMEPCPGRSIARDVGDTDTFRTDRS